MNVKLRGTLKELGFKRKSPTTYIHERPDVTRVFEVHHDKWNEGFYDMAGVQNHAMGQILRDVLGEEHGHMRVMRNPCHSSTSIGNQVAIEIVDGPTNSAPRSLILENNIETYPDVSRHLEFYGDHLWLPVMNPRGVYDPVELDRIYDERVAAFGPYLDDMFRRYLLPWYELSDDPAQFARWYEDHMRGGYRKYLGMIVAYHLAGDPVRVQELINDRIEEANLPYEVFRRVLEATWGRKRWRRWLGLHLLYNRQKSDEIARNLWEAARRTAEQAKRLAGAFGVRV